MNKEMENIKVRNHASYIIEQIWGSLVIVALIVVGNLRELQPKIQSNGVGVNIEILVIFLIVALIVLVLVGVKLFQWYRTTFIIKEGTIIYEKKTINRVVQTIALKNISNINLEQNLFEMLIGTMKLKIDTNTMSTAEKTDVQIVLKKKNAKEMKQYLVAMMEKIQEENSEQDITGEETTNGKKTVDSLMETEKQVETEKYDITYTKGEMIQSVIASSSFLLLFIAIALLASAIGSSILIAQSGKGFSDVAINFVTQIFVSGSCFMIILKRAEQDFNFCVKRNKDKIYVSCGLFTRRNYTVPIEKINAVIVHYSALGRIMKKGYIKVINVGGQGEDVDGMKLLLAQDFEKLQEKMKIVLPEFEIEKKERYEKSPKRYLYKRFAVNSFWGMILLILDGIAMKCVRNVKQDEMISAILLSIGIFVTYMVCALLVSYLTYKTSGIHLKEKYLYVSNGVFVRKLIVIPYDKIEYIHLKQGPLEQKMNLCNGMIFMLASAVSREQSIGTFDVNRMKEIEKMFQKTY